MAIESVGDEVSNFLWFTALGSLLEKMRQLSRTSERTSVWESVLVADTVDAYTFEIMQHKRKRGEK